MTTARRLRFALASMLLVVLGACDFEVDIDDFIRKTTPMSESADAEVRKAKAAEEKARYAAEANKLWDDVLVNGNSPYLDEKTESGEPKTKLDKALELDPNNSVVRAAKYLEARDADIALGNRGSGPAESLIQLQELLRTIARNRTAQRAGTTPPEREPQTAAEIAAERKAIAQRGSQIVIEATAKRLAHGGVGEIRSRTQYDSDWNQFVDYCNSLATHDRQYPTDTWLELHKLTFGNVPCPANPRRNPPPRS